MQELHGEFTKAREEHLIAQQRLLNERIRWLNDQQSILAGQVNDLNEQKIAHEAREVETKLLANEVEVLTEDLQEKMSQKAQRNLNLLKRVDTRQLADERLAALQAKVTMIEQEVEAKKKACELAERTPDDSRLDALERELTKTRDKIAQLEAKSDEWAYMLDELQSKEGSSASKLKVSLNMREFELNRHEAKLQTQLKLAQVKASKLIAAETDLKQEKAKVAGAMRQLRQQRLDLDQKSSELKSLDITLSQATSDLEASIAALNLRLKTQPTLEESDRDELSMLKDRLRKLDDRDAAMDAKIELAQARNQELTSRLSAISDQEETVTVRRQDLTRLEMEIKRREFSLNSRGDIEGELDLRLQGLLLSEAVRQKRHSEELRALRELATVATAKEKTLKARIGESYQ